MDHIFWRQLPGSSDFRQPFGINFNLARWRFQWVGLRIFSELLEGHHVLFRAFALINTGAFHLLIAWHLRIAFAGFLTQVFDPLLLVAPLGEGCFGLWPNPFGHL
ncbi:hypothetical protein D3C75_952500 [compost metagenome]